MSPRTPNHTSPATTGGPYSIFNYMLVPRVCAAWAHVLRHQIYRVIKTQETSGHPSPSTIGEAIFHRRQALKMFQVRGVCLHDLLKDRTLPRAAPARCWAMLVGVSSFHGARLKKRTPYNFRGFLRRIARGIFIRCAHDSELWGVLQEPASCIPMKLGVYRLSSLKKVDANERREQSLLFLKSGISRNI